jgi:hypothetical protein
VGASVLLIAPPAAAQGTADRAGHWQFSIPINFVAGTEIDGKGGSTVDVQDDVGWGVAFGYHLDNRFLLGFEVTWLRASYDATIEVDENGDGTPDGSETIGGSLDASSFQLVGQYNVLERSRITPFVRASLGSSYTDSNIPSAPPQGTCWWDPWLGYICGAWQPTYDRLSFSYGLGAGIRADLGRRFFLEGAFNGSWISLPDDTPFLTGARLNVGWTF